MSYQVLARKWRPYSFDTLVGQTHVVRALVNALNQDRLHHAYLFTGTRGVGKTTLGRILAKCLNCEIGITATPCQTCPACTEIASGRFIDLIEVDAASKTKVEDTRELLENIPYAPTSGRFKVYLIDEVHMLSTSSFNALLKTLEEPPPHVKFILATTDPQKLPVTVLSRCLQFHLKALSLEQISGQLAFILKEEQLPFEPEALNRLAYAAEGSMRDALSLLDQAIAFSNNQVTSAAIKSMLSTIEATYLYEILDALQNKQAEKLIMVTQQISEQSLECANVLEELLSLLHRLAIAQYVPNMTDDGIWDNGKITALAQSLSAQDIQLFYQIALIGRKDLPLAPTPRMGLEMVLLRMLAFYPSDHNAPRPKSVNQASVVNTKAAPLKPETATTDQSPTWSNIVQALNLSGMTAAIANHCILEQLTDNDIILMIEPKQSVLLNKKHEERLALALQAHFNRPLHLTIRTGQTHMTSPAAQKEIQQTLQKSDALHALSQDQNVQQIMSTFNAQILPDSVVSHNKD